MRYLLIFLVIALAGCFSDKGENHSSALALGKEVNSEFLIAVVDSSLTEIDGPSFTANQSQFCDWMENFELEISHKILKASAIGKEDFEFVGYARAADKFFVKYGAVCKLLEADEISPKVFNSFHQIRGCVKPEDNQYEPRLFSNCFSKPIYDSTGVKGVFQIWYNKKEG